MKQGFDMRQKEILELHNQTLFINRMNTALLMNMHTKKSIKPTDLYSLLGDKAIKRNVRVVTQEDIKRMEKTFSRSIPKEEKKTKQEILG
jgi:hypothetical protein